MNITKEYIEPYIEMCIKAKEIQNLNPVVLDNFGYAKTFHFEYTPECLGGYFYDMVEKEIITVGSVNVNNGVCDDCTADSDPHIWLPTLGQLHNMILEYYQTHPDQFKIFVGDSFNTTILKNLSIFSQSVYGGTHLWNIEMFYLTYFMMIKYDKMWDGKEWT
jgi:hypothetical protein